MFDAQREACVAAAQAGGKVLMGFFRKLDPATITEKTKNDVVSEADREAEAAIRAELARRFPDTVFLARRAGSSRPPRGGPGREALPPRARRAGAMHRAQRNR